MGQQTKLGCPMIQTVALWCTLPIRREALLVDLGHGIGTPRWWLGSLGLSCAISALLSFGSLTPTTNPALPLGALKPLPFSTAAAVGPLMTGAQTGWQMPMTHLAQPLKEFPEKPRIELSFKSQAESQVALLLKRASASKSDLKLAEIAIRKSAAPLSVYQETDAYIVMGQRDTKRVPRPLETLVYRADFDTRVELTRTGDGFAAQIFKIPVVDSPKVQSVRVGASIYASAKRAGVPQRVVASLVSALRYSVDFERDVSARDMMTVVFDRQITEDGLVRTGELQHVSLDLSERDKPVELLRFAPTGERTEFFYPDGMSVRALLMKTPVDGARQTSGFGFRLHPILGYSRLHQGADFAAPSGTPIQAAGVGTVVHAGWHGGHGKTVIVQHQNGLRTLYAHMSAIGVSVGQRVAQGQSIGGVGSTGLSTGPHLHYEIHVGGRAVNPNDAKLPTGRKLQGRDLESFRSLLAKVRSIQPDMAARTDAAAVKALKS
jgi:murein DD-endopeptidase MepM/ murein hydrolase activator NlpD